MMNDMDKFQWSYDWYLRDNDTSDDKSSIETNHKIDKVDNNDHTGIIHPFFSI